MDTQDNMEEQRAHAYQAIITKLEALLSKLREAGPEDSDLVAVSFCYLEKLREPKEEEPGYPAAAESHGYIYDDDAGMGLAKELMGDGSALANIIAERQGFVIEEIDLSDNEDGTVH